MIQHNEKNQFETEQMIIVDMDHPSRRQTKYEDLLIKLAVIMKPKVYNCWPLSSYWIFN